MKTILLLLIALFIGNTLGGLPCKRLNQKLRLSGKWRDYGGDYQGAKISKTNGRVAISGLIYGNYRSGRTIAVLPVGFRPYKRLVFAANNHQYVTRIDVLKNGEIQLVTNNRHNWVSLSNINFVAGPRKGLRKQVPLANGWRNYGGPYAPATYYKRNNVVYLSGLIAGNTYKIATLPKGYRPLARQIFVGDNHDRQTRIDVLANGDVVRVTHQWHRWLSLSNVRFGIVNKPRHGIYLNLRWVPYGGTYDLPYYVKVGNRVYLQGLIRGAYGVIGYLPAGVRPEKRLVFLGNNHQGQTRIDVLANGQIHRVTGNSHNWVSLSNVNFLTRNSCIGCARKDFRLSGSECIPKGYSLSKICRGGSRKIAYNSKFSDYAYEYRRGYFSKQNGRVYLHGLVKGSSSRGRLLTILPVGYRPRARLVFAVNNHQYVTRVDVLKNGRVEVVTNNRHNWLSLENINFVPGPRRGQRQLPLSGRFRNYGHSYDGATYYKRNNIVHLGGLIAGKYGRIGTLPVGYRPNKQLIFVADNHDRQTRVDVYPNGNIHVHTHQWHNWLSLSNIHFAIGPQTRLKLQPGYRPYGGTYKYPTFTKVGNIVYVQGLVRGTSYEIAKLPSGYRPNRRVALLGNNHQGQTRVDVLPDGRIVKVTGNSHNWVSLSNVIFSTVLPKCTCPAGNKRYGNKCYKKNN